jgi:hypothetical protein
MENNKLTQLVFNMKNGINLLRDNIFSFISMDLLKLYIFESIDYDDLMFVDFIMLNTKNCDISNISKNSILYLHIIIHAINLESYHILTRISRDIAFSHWFLRKNAIFQKLDNALCNTNINYAMVRHNVFNIKYGTSVPNEYIYEGTLKCIKFMISSTGIRKFNINIITLFDRSSSIFKYLYINGHIDVSNDDMSTIITNVICSNDLMKLNFLISLNIDCNDYITELHSNKNIFAIKYLLSIDKLIISKKEWTIILWKHVLLMDSQNTKYISLYIHLLHKYRLLEDTIIHKTIHFICINNNTINIDTYSRFMTELVDLNYQISITYLYRLVNQFSNVHITIKTFTYLIYKIQFLKKNNDEYECSELSELYNNLYDIDDIDNIRIIKELIKNGSRISIKLLYDNIINNNLCKSNFCDYITWCKESSDS